VPVVVIVIQEMETEDECLTDYRKFNG